MVVGSGGSPQQLRGDQPVEVGGMTSRAVGSVWRVAQAEPVLTRRGSRPVHSAGCVWFLAMSHCQGQKDPELSNSGHLASTTGCG